MIPSIHRAASVLLLGTAVLAGLPAQKKPHAFVNARIETCEGSPIESGLLVVQGGKILFVGAADAPIPAGAVTVDCAGKTVMPGLVCSHSHIGSVSGADRSGPIQPEVRALDAINPRDPGIQKAQAGGITTANVMPGSG
ncbi:MAG: amidohydrolase, partial [Planctomycetota bacterium]